MLILFNFLRILHRIFPESGFLTYLNYSVDCLDEILFFFSLKAFLKSLSNILMQEDRLEEHGLGSRDLPWSPSCLSK